ALWILLPEETTRIMNNINQQRHFFESGKSRNADFRIDQLKKLKHLLQQNEDAFFEALQTDFKKPAFETYATELLILYQEIDLLTKNIKQWSEPKKVSGSMLNFPSRNYIHSQPYGISLVIGAWNYPIQLTLNPVLGSMAAGNCTIVKPSELAPATAELLDQTINAHFDSGYLQVVQGDAETTQQLLDQPLDYIFFTGSTRVGKIIMKAAAEQLTPVTLELGGKSPAIVDRSADLKTAARRIGWGKFINAGQTCVSPDYVYIHRSQQDTFCELIEQQISEFYGSDPKNNPDYARILNRNHFNRLKQMIDPKKTIAGGQTDADELYIAPTAMKDISWQDDVMQEEIFGPILPILTYQKIEEAIRAVQNHPKPLAFYLFTSDDKVEQEVIETVPFGGGCINDTVAHLANMELPFGGIGQSGIGNYHGKASFDLFSHQKSVMHKGTWLDIPL